MSGWPGGGQKLTVRTACALHLFCLYVRDPWLILSVRHVLAGTSHPRSTPVLHGLACLRLLCVLPGRHHGGGRLSSCLVSLRGRELAWWSLSPAPSSPTAVGRRGVAVRPGPRVIWPRAASWGPCRAMWPAVSEFRGVEAGHTPRFRPRSHPAKTRPKRPRAADRWVPLRPPRAVIFSGGSLHGPYPRIQASV